MSSIFDRSIKARLVALVGVSTVGLAAILGLAVYLLHQYSIKGPVYEKAVIYKELDTEVSPPAMFLSPSFIALLQMNTETNPADIRDLTDRYRAREERFRSRYDHWIKRLPDGDLKDSLEKKVRDPAMEFYKVAREEYLPLVGKPAEKARAEQVVTQKLTPLFRKQHQGVD